MKRHALLSALLVLAGSLAPALAEEATSWAVSATVRHRVVPDVTYLTAGGQESKLDLIVPRDAPAPVPTLIYIHGGGWVGGSKEASDLALLPWIEQGWAVVNVEYRLGPVSLAPAAVEDCRCALRWVRENAATYGLDPNRIVVTGHSAGGHLSLTTGMLSAGAGFDNLCPKRNQDRAAGGPADVAVEEMPVAAIVNWFGITDVGDLIAGENAKTYAVQWMGSLPDRFELAKRLSPIELVRPGLPPVLTLHGDADPIVPYQHAVQLHAALDRAGVPNELHTILGGSHGGFDAEQTLEAYRVIREFVARHVTGPSS
ncbi:MAG TPA: alpha/beta hydrolase [Thermoanaerobaculia bacterium]|nr:alpha/beta hydrolase [Thermoanaerobaculia bacterium]